MLAVSVAAAWRLHVAARCADVGTDGWAEANHGEWNIANNMKTLRVANRREAMRFRF